MAASSRIILFPSCVGGRSAPASAEREDNPVSPISLHDTLSRGGLYLPDASREAFHEAFHVSPEPRRLGVWLAAFGASLVIWCVFVGGLLLAVHAPGTSPRAVYATGSAR